MLPRSCAWRCLKSGLRAMGELPLITHLHYSMSITHAVVIWEESHCLHDTPQERKVRGREQPVTGTWRMWGNTCPRIQAAQWLSMSNAQCPVVVNARNATEVAPVHNSSLCTRSIVHTHCYLYGGSQFVYLKWKYAFDQCVYAWCTLC